MSRTDDVVDSIRAERLRQKDSITGEGFSECHDDQYRNGELAAAAACYAIAVVSRSRYEQGTLTLTQAADMLEEALAKFWPWHIGWFKPGLPLRDLEKAGALIVAEIERRKRGNKEEKYNAEIERRKRVNKEEKSNVA